MLSVHLPHARVTPVTIGYADSPWGRGMASLKLQLRFARETGSAEVGAATLSPLAYER